METAEDEVLFQMNRWPSTAVYVISCMQSSDLLWEWNTADSYIPADAAVQERGVGGDPCSLVGVRVKTRTSLLRKFSQIRQRV